ncbi:Transcription initiation protein SPT3-like protein [Operophtera brumata]|uniref:Transcription initiation protein SPT3-like protein n=1 Tax=Operophtera brumata TaxID=104452 RepID=A0A0L7L263_OPEBR|nr:Transcription initiation protein SPT3-like protein [Operophtera brumata]
MMYGFGDSPNPNPETVLLIESIVLQQLRSLLKEAYQVSVERGKKNITNYELIYLMYTNRNVLKMKRLHDFQLAQDEIEEIDEFVLPEEFITDEEGDVIIETASNAWRKRTHIDIIKELDKKGEVKNINYDYLGHLRKIRAKNLTDAMSSEEYEPFQEARRSSFRTSTGFKHRFSKLKEWVIPNREYKITNSALEVLSFIAYETVADIVDAVLLTRRSSSKGVHCFSSTLKLNNGVSVQWAIGVMEVHEALTNYFTPRVWLNGLFYKKMGLEYLSGLVS